MEAVINIIVSVLCIHKFGMAGVLFGTACSYAYRSVEVMIYNHKKLVKGSGGKSLARVLRNWILLIFAGIKFVPQQMDSFIIWFVYALAAGVVSAVAIVVVNMGFEPKEFKALIKRVTGIIRK